MFFLPSLQFWSVVSMSTVPLVFCWMCVWLHNSDEAVPEMSWKCWCANSLQFWKQIESSQFNRVSHVICFFQKITGKGGMLRMQMWGTSLVEGVTLCHGIYEWWPAALLHCRTWLSFTQLEHALLMTESSVAVLSRPQEAVLQSFATRPAPTMSLPTLCLQHLIKNSLKSPTKTWSCLPEFWAAIFLSKDLTHMRGL